jgi:hypothetical protein
MEQMTLTRALNEIKLLEKKIARFSEPNVMWLAVSKNGKISGVQSIDQLKSTVEANKQKLNDFITNRNDLKKKLLEANNKITVTVSGKTYTIAEAIDRKAFITTEKHIFSTLNHQVIMARNAFDVENQRLDEKVERTITQALGGDGKKDPAVVEGIEKSVRENMKIILEDPAKVADWVAKTLIEIEEFENEIDFVLSEANAKNTIDA